MNPDDSFGRRFVDTSRQFIYVVRHQWKDVLRDSSQGVSQVPGADFFGEVSGVDAAIEAILAAGEGDYSDVVLAASGIFLGKVNWVLGRGKSATRWANQMRKRGWDNQQITEALTTEGIPARNAVNPGNPASRHVHPTTGRSVVIDNKTNEILHVGGDGFEYSDWDL